MTNDNNNDWKFTCLIWIMILSCVNAYTCTFEPETEHGITLWKVTAVHGFKDRVYITDIDNTFDTRTKFAICDALLDTSDTVYCHDTIWFTLLQSTFLLIN